MYTVTGYTIEQTNCDNNGACENPKSAKKDYLVEIKGNMLKVSKKGTSTSIKLEMAGNMTELLSIRTRFTW